MRSAPLDILPSLGSANKPNGVFAHSEHLRRGLKFSGAQIFFFYCTRFFCGDLREGAHGPTPKVIPCVLLILFFRRVFEILKPVIGAIPIFVIHLAVIRAWTNERRHNATVNLKRAFSRDLFERDNKVSVFICSLLTNDVIPVAGALDSPKITNLVKTFPFRDWLPNFFHSQSPIIERLRVKAHGIRAEAVFGSYPSHAKEILTC